LKGCLKITMGVERGRLKGKGDLVLYRKAKETFSQEEVKAVEGGKTRLTWQYRKLHGKAMWWSPGRVSPRQKIGSKALRRAEQEG